MSHFAVAVFNREGQDIESLLAPFDENLSVEPYIVYTRERAIDYAREHYKMEDKTDQECWDFMAQDYEIRDEDGNLYSTYNPLSKWDYWMEGGRWNGCLIDHGERVNTGRVRDVSLYFSEEKYKKVLRLWDVLVGHQPKEEGESFGFYIYTEEYTRERYKDRESFAKSLSHFIPYAVLMPDGGWIACGDMGWFGMGSESVDKAREWEESFEERFLKSADPDWYITIVDCHI